MHYIVLLRLRASPQGGAEGIRTPDLRRAKAALSRLSYGPTPTGWASLESNQGPQSYQDCALADLATGPHPRRVYWEVEKLRLSPQGYSPWTSRHPLAIGFAPEQEESGAELSQVCELGTCRKERRRGVENTSEGDR